MNDKALLAGWVVVERFNADGVLVERSENHNLVTQVGDQMYAERGAGIASPPASPTGIRLGTGATTGANAVDKTGTGATLATYLSGSNKAFDATYPSSALNGAARRITYKRTFAPGEATTTSAITEAVIVNDTIATDATSTSANTIARGVITGISEKDSGDTLTVTWYHDLLGA